MHFQELKQDALKAQQLLKKLGPGEDKGHSQSILASSLQFGLAIEFEKSDHVRRCRLFLSEMLGLLNQLDSPGPFKFFQSDLFECEVHLEEICDIMCITVAGIYVDPYMYMALPSLVPRLPNLFQCTQEKEGEPGIQHHMSDIGPIYKDWKGGGS